MANESRVFRLPAGMSTQVVANAVEAFLSSAKGMEVQSAETTEGYVVQGRQEKDGWKTIAGMRMATTMQMIRMDDNLNVTVGQGEWSDKIGAGALGWFIAWPLAVTAGVGAYDSAFHATEDMLCIDYCRQGRMEYPAGPDTYSYVEAGDLKLDRRLEHQGHFTFPLSHYHGITIGFTLPLAAQSLKEWMRDFPVDLVRLQEKFCAGRHPRVIHGAPSVDHIFQELYAVPEQIKQPYFRIKVLELLLYLDALELDGRTEKPYFYKSQVEKVKAAHRLLTEDLERHYTIAELSERFSIPATALKECFKSVYGQPVNTYMRNLRMDRAALLLRLEPRTSVAEIAGRVGYDSASKFAAVFKEAKGKTPLEYRREGR